MSMPIINLLKCKLIDSDATKNVLELSDEANAHLNVMYSFTDDDLSIESIMSRANCIVRWLYDTHPNNRNCDVIIGDMPALVPALTIKLKKFGYNPLVLLNSPTKHVLPVGCNYDLSESLIFAET